MRINEKVLVLKHNTKPITKIIRSGKRIQYQLKDDSTIYHGHIRQLQNDSLVINNNAVFLSKLKMIHGKPVSLNVVRGLGIILVIAGTFVLYMGIVALHSKHTTGLLFPDALLSMIGIIMVYFGLAGDLLGLIPFFITTKVYDLEKEWSIKIGTRQRNRFSLGKNKLDCCD